MAGLRKVHEGTTEREKDQYKKAFDLTLALSKQNLSEELVALYLGGSYLRGDFIPGWSDIDITAIVRDEVWENESLKSRFFKKCESICREVEDTCPDVKVGLGMPKGTTCESVIREKANLALFLLRTEKLIFGRDVLREAAPIDLEKVPEWGRAAALWLCDDLATFLQDQPDEENLVDASRYVVVDIMKIAQNSLFAKGMIVLRKREIVDAFERAYSLLKSNNVVREAYRLELSWQRVLKDRDKLMAFLNDAKKFVLDLKGAMVARGNL